MDEIFTEYQLVQDTVRLYDNKISITPKGALGFLNKGIKGSKDIPFKSITAIQFKEASSVLNGFIQFSLHGGSESKKGVLDAASDENSFFFSLKDQPKILELKAFIEDRMSDKPRAMAESNKLDELTKLAGLKASGTITEEEFLKLKENILSGSGEQKSSSRPSNQQTENFAGKTSIEAAGRSLAAQEAFPKKKISIVSGLFIIILSMVAFGALASGEILGGVIYFLAAFTLTPIFSRYLQTKFEFSLKGPHKFILVFSLMLIGASFGRKGRSDNDMAMSSMTTPNAAPSQGASVPSEKVAPKQATASDKKGAYEADKAKGSYLKESCESVAGKFDHSSRLSDLQKDELWESSYKGKIFKWTMKVTEVKSGMLSGFHVFLKCKNSSALVSDLMMEFPNSDKDVVIKLEKGSYYDIKGKLTNQSPTFGLYANPAFD